MTAANPFADDQDRAFIWEMLMPRDFAAFAAQDWDTPVRARFGRLLSSSPFWMAATPVTFVPLVPWLVDEPVPRKLGRAELTQRQLEGLRLLMEVTGQIRDSGANPGLTLAGLVMTMYDGRTNLNPAVVSDVREHFQEVVFDTLIPRTVRFAEAPSHGLTVLEHDPHGAGAEAYRALAHEFLDRQQQGISFVSPQAAA